MSQPLRAVLFDYGHTLIHFDERPHAALLAAYQRVNDLLRTQLEREVPEAQVLIERVSLIVDQEIQRDYETGREEEVEIATLYDASLRQIGLELKPELIERVMELEQEGWIGSVHVGPDVVPTLEVIRGEGLKLGLVSNAAYLPSLMLGQLRALGLEQYFDGITFSSGIGWRKPHPAMSRSMHPRSGPAVRQRRKKEISNDPTPTLRLHHAGRAGPVADGECKCTAAATRQARQVGSQIGSQVDPA